MRKLFLFALPLAAVAAALLGVPYLAKRYLEQRLPAMLADGCPSCNLRYSSLRVTLLPPRVSLTGVWFYSGVPEITAGEARIDRLEFDFAISALLKREIHATRILVTMPRVVVTEGDRRALPDSTAHEASAWAFSASALKVVGGTFTYDRLYVPKTASLHVTEIDADVGPWDSREPARVTEGVATGLLERSGRFTLTVKTPIFLRPPVVDVTLKMNHLNLADLEPFFFPSEGLKLKGELREGSSEARIDAAHEEAWVEARYVGLDLHFKATRRRGPLKSFLFNLVESFKIKTADTARPEPKRVRGVELNRNPHESMISFIIRGMRNAALRVATQE